MSKKNLAVFLLGAFLFGITAQAQISRWVYKYFPQKPEKYAYPQRISFASKKIKEPEKALKEDGEYLALSSGEKLIIDFGADVGGFFEFKIKLKKPAKIQLYYAEALEFARGKKKYYLWFSPPHRKLLERNYKVSESGWFQDPVLMGGARYLVFEVSSGRLELDGIRCKKSFYPCNPAEAGWFLSSDELLNRIWYAGYYTTCLNTVRPDQGGLSGKEKIGVGNWVIIDGAKRDRLVWSGDLQIANRVVYATSGKYEFAKNSLESLAKDQFKTGQYPSCSVADIGKQVADDFLEYTIWQIINSYDYYLYSGDYDFIKKNYSGIKKAMDFLDKHTDENGLLKQNPFKGGQNYSYTLLRWGKISYVNALYYLGLKRASQIALAMNDPGQAQIYLTRAEQIERWFNDFFWDEKAGAYKEKKRDRSHHPLDGNALAILSGLADEGKARAVLNFIDQNLKLDWGDRQVEKAFRFPRKIPILSGHNYKNVLPLINAFEVQARFQLGDDAGGLDLIRRCWGQMVNNDPNYTTWEWLGKDGKPDQPITSLAHPWSSGATFILSEYILGVKPTSPGFSDYLIEPHPVDLKWAKGAVPSPRGLIKISWKNSPEKFELELNLPKGNGAMVKVPKKSGLCKIWLNQKVIYDAGSSFEHPEGKFLGESERYYKIMLFQGGTYKLKLEKVSGGRK